jgi:NitT/TauT family transport system substrate-binding protein
VNDPAAAVDSVVRRNNVAEKSFELERLQLALRDNVLTPEVQANGFGAIDTARLDKAIEQISLAYPFRSGRPKADDIFDSSFLPAETERRAH